MIPNPHGSQLNYIDESLGLDDFVSDRARVQITCPVTAAHGLLEVTQEEWIAHGINSHGMLYTEITPATVVFYDTQVLGAVGYALYVCLICGSDLGSATQLATHLTTSHGWS